VHSTQRLPWRSLSAGSSEQLIGGQLVTVRVPDRGRKASGGKQTIQIREFALKADRVRVSSLRSSCNVIHCTGVFMTTTVAVASSGEIPDRRAPRQATVGQAGMALLDFTYAARPVPRRVPARTRLYGGQRYEAARWVWWTT